MAFQVAVASTAGVVEHERLAVALDGNGIDGREVAVEHGGRVHLVDCGPGILTVHYEAAVTVPAPVDGSGRHDAVDEVEALVALRQSRYCPSDAMEHLAGRELGELAPGADGVAAIGEWVHDRLRYESGSSGPLDTAVDTLLAGRGVCRDFAHLTITLCRAVGIPARLAAVYAPGITPMDFHAVAEVAVDGRWLVVDATRLAPRQSLLRIATGRDAADTAFATTTTGSLELLSSTVTAVHGDDALPLDDHRHPVSLP